MPTNLLSGFAGQLQTVSGKLAAALERRGFSVAEYIAWLAKEGNDPAIEDIAVIADRMPFFRETGEVVIKIPALPRPTLAELREKFPWIREENGIEHDVSSTVPVTLKLGTVLRSNEPSINGAEYERRIVPILNSTLGYQHREWLVEHQEEHPALMELVGKVYIDFPALIVVGEGGLRRCPCMDQDGRRFAQFWLWVGGDLDRRGRVAFSGK